MPEITPDKDGKITAAEQVATDCRGNTDNRALADAIQGVVDQAVVEASNELIAKFGVIVDASGSKKAQRGLTALCELIAKKPGPAVR